MRSLKKLLQVLLDNIDEFKDTTYPESLCFITDKLIKYEIINDSEQTKLDDYLYHEAEIYNSYHLHLILISQTIEHIYHLFVYSLLSSCH